MQKFFDALARMLYYKKCGVEIFRHIDVKKYANQPVIVVANTLHAWTTLLSITQ